MCLNMDQNDMVLCVSAISNCDFWSSRKFLLNSSSSWIESWTISSPTRHICNAERVHHLKSYNGDWGHDAEFEIMWNFKILKLQIQLREKNKKYPPETDPLIPQKNRHCLYYVSRKSKFNYGMHRVLNPQYKPNQ